MIVVDPDAHYLEDYTILADYLDEPVRSKIKNMPRHWLVPNSTGDRMLAGRISRTETGGESKLTQPADVPKIMDFLDVNVSIQISNLMLTLPNMNSRELAVGLTQGFIEYMLDRVVNPEAGVFSTIIVPTQDPKKAADLIYRYGSHPGIASVTFITQWVSPPLGDVHYDPIYRAASEVGLPIVYHASGAGLDHFIIDGFQKFIETYTLGFLFHNLATLVSVLIQGLPERFPTLKYVFQEAGVAYIPGIMYRLDEVYLKRRSEAPLLKMLPSEYMKTFYYGTQPLERPERLDHMAAIFEMIDGENRLMFATDYPHFDYDRPTAILELPFISDDGKRKILGANALGVYRFQDWKAPEQPAPPAPEAAATAVAR
jgi:predicted TIM-barrel fold metal-dependent hydrolase